MKLLLDILQRNGLELPDGRALHAYETDSAELKALADLLKLRISLAQLLPTTAQA